MNNKIFNLTIAFSLFNLTVLPLRLPAQMAESNQNINMSVNFKQPEPPPDAPKSGRAKGGASRGKCSLANSTSNKGLTLIPLLPSDGWGLTVSESPALWVYISYSSGRFEGETPLIAELSVEERKTDLKLEPKSYPVKLPKTSGLFSISLPHSLGSDQWYRWYLVVNCQGENPSSNDVLQIEGFLHRKDLTKPSKSALQSELINFYTNNNIWYDAFHQAALLHCNNKQDNDLSNYWQTLLKNDAVKLDEMSDHSVICPDY